MKPETKGAALVLGLSVIWKTLLLLTGWVDGFLGKYPLLPILGFLLIAMYRTMEERRKLTYSNGVPFKEAFRSGMSVAALFSLTYSLFIYIYLFYLDTQFKVRFVNQRVADMVAQKTPQTDIDAWRLSTAEFPFEMSWLVFTFIGVLVLGVFYAAMMARMMARKYPLPKA